MVKYYFYGIFFTNRHKSWNWSLEIFFGSGLVFFKLSGQLDSWRKIYMWVIYHFKTDLFKNVNWNLIFVSVIHKGSNKSSLARFQGNKNHMALMFLLLLCFFYQQTFFYSCLNTVWKHHTVSILRTSFVDTYHKKHWQMGFKNGTFSSCRNKYA